MDDAEHTLFVCARWGVAREAAGRVMGAQLTPDTMIPLMLQSEDIWMHIKSFVNSVMRTKDFDGRSERSNGDGKYEGQ